MSDPRVTKTDIEVAGKTYRVREHPEIIPFIDLYENGSLVRNVPYRSVKWYRVWKAHREAACQCSTQ